MRVIIIILLCIFQLRSCFYFPLWFDVLLLVLHFTPLTHRPCTQAAEVGRKRTRYELK